MPKPRRASGRVAESDMGALSERAVEDPRRARPPDNGRAHPLRVL
jgi:hypothetical protein